MPTDSTSRRIQRRASVIRPACGSWQGPSPLFLPCRPVYREKKSCTLPASSVQYSRQTTRETLFSLSGQGGKALFSNAIRCALHVTTHTCLTLAANIHTSSSGLPAGRLRRPPSPGEKPLVCWIFRKQRTPPQKPSPPSKAREAATPKPWAACAGQPGQGTPPCRRTGRSPICRPPPRTLAALLAVACLLSFGAAGVVAVDLQAGLGAGTFHLVRQPVSRDAGGLFTAVAVMESLAILLCLGVGLLEVWLLRRCRQDSRLAGDPGQRTGPTRQTATGTRPAPGNPPRPPRRP